MASIEEEAAKRYALMKKLNPWMAIDYLEAQIGAKEAQIGAKDQEIAHLLREIERLRKSYSIESGND